MTQLEHSARGAALRWAKTHGRTAASFHALDRGLSHWFHRDGCVGYVDTGGAWVAAGGPLSARHHEPAVMEAFRAEGRRRGKRVYFFALESPVAPSGYRVVHLGEQPVWDPQRWPKDLSKRLRGQIRRAKANSIVAVRCVQTQELADERSAVREQLDRLVANWLASRRIAPMGFLVSVDLHHLRAERRFFVAENEAGLVAALVAVPIYERRGWFLDSMLRADDAPNGAVELLFDHVMEVLAAEGSRYVTFGLCPLSGVDSSLLQAIRRHTGRLYNYDGLRKFKSKLGPGAWHPVYIASPPETPEALAIWDCLAAFLPGGYARFLGRTLLLQASLVATLASAMTALWAALRGLHFYRIGALGEFSCGLWLALSITCSALAFRLGRSFTARLSATLGGLLALLGGWGLAEQLRWQEGVGDGVTAVGWLAVASTLLAAQYFSLAACSLHGPSPADSPPAHRTIGDDLGLPPRTLASATRSDREPTTIAAADPTTGAAPEPR